MKPLLSCREAASLLLRVNDVPISLIQKLRMRLHLAICGACTNFSKQVKVMNGAMGPWRAYRDEDDHPGP
ncbi:MAG: zf-HC2 domain-containing protein [Ideonella sp.]|nr:zf-HC2 domain-containing protein [Ideonella sp.]